MEWLDAIVSAAKREVNIMKSHVIAATLFGAALVPTAAAAAQTSSTLGRAMNGTLIESTVPSTNVPAQSARVD